MDDTAKRALDSNMRFFQTNLVLTDELYGGLIQHEVLTEDMMDRVRSKKTTGGQVLCLIQTLKKRGKLAFSHFMGVLRDTGQSHVAETLELVIKCQRQGSEHVHTKEKMRSFIHKNFIMDRHFTLEDERFLLEHLVMTDDWEAERKGRLQMVDKNSELQVELRDRNTQVDDLNRRLQFTLVQHRAQVAKIQTLEAEKKALVEKIDELEAAVKDSSDSTLIKMLSIDSNDDEVDGSAPAESEAEIKECIEKEESAKDALYKAQAEELDYTRQQLDVMKERARMSSCKLGSLADKVKAFLAETCQAEEDHQRYNTQLQKLEASIDSLMNQMKSVKQQQQSNTPQLPAEHAVVTRQGSVINLKDKLSETRRQKSELKSELSEVQKRLRVISSELEAEKTRVRKLEADLHSRESSRANSGRSDLSSRPKTPVNVHFPFINSRPLRQSSSVNLWASTPQSLMSSMRENTGFHSNSIAKVVNTKQKQDISYKLSQPPSPGPNTGRLQVKCSRCNSSYGGSGEEAGALYCRYHPGTYTHSTLDGQDPRWPCCGQTNKLAPGCRQANHVPML